MHDVLPSRVRPFGPLPRAAVAIYGVLLAGAGLVLSLQAGQFDGFGATGVGGLLLGVACVLLAVRVGRGPKEAPRNLATPEVPVDPKHAAAQLVTELEALRRQLDAPLDVA